MMKKLVAHLVLFIIFLLVVIPVSSPKTSQLRNSLDFAFNQELNIPINTSYSNAKYQPIDIKIKFDNPCWAKDEVTHSVRVFCNYDNVYKELESQIYGLEFIDTNHIRSCNLVFLIPEEANGEEKYYVYYDKVEKSSPNYHDHVSVDEYYYKYEPLPGMLLESSIYKVTDEGFIVYTVTQKGKALDDPLCHTVTKIKSGSKDLSPKNFDQTVLFNLVYWYEKDGVEKLSTTAEQFVSKEILVDGNLMVEFKIVSKSNDEVFQTEVNYKYYYNPTDDKNIRAHVKHEVINPPVPYGDKIWLFYASLNTAEIESGYIEELNSGWMPSFMHAYNEKERVLVYDVDPYPDNEWESLITKKDDCDLGSRPWVSLDDGESGSSHGLIFSSPNILLSGYNESDGLSIQAGVGKIRSIQFMRVHNRFFRVLIGRNTYETGIGEDNILPDNLSVEFDAEFFSSKNDGYKAVEEEVKFFQSLNGNNIKNNLPDYYDIIYSKGLSPLYNLDIDITDNLGLFPDATMQVGLKSNDFNDTLLINGVKTSKNKYIFRDIYPGNFTLKIYYKSIIFEETIKISNNLSLSVNFPVEYNVSFHVFDTYGNFLNNAKILLSREGKKLEGNIDENGRITFSIPPGIYDSEIFSGENLIAKRKISIVNQKKVSIVTTENPQYPLITIFLTFFIIIGAAIFAYKIRNKMVFLKILAISLALVSIVSPWWVLLGSSSSPEIETSSKLFLIPHKLVSLTNTPEVSAGELIPLPRIFIDALNVTLIMIILGVIFICLSLIIKRFNRRKLSVILTIFGFFSFILSIIIFSYGMSELANVGFGSFIGSDNLEIFIPGENSYEKVSCNWGPGLGLYLCLISVGIIIIIIMINFKEILAERKYRKTNN